MSNRGPLSTLRCWFRDFAVLSVLLAVVSLSRAEEPASEPSTNQAQSSDTSSDKSPDVAKSAESKPPQPAPQRDAAAINASIQRGVHFLLDHQNKTGSWGSADNVTGDDIYAPVPAAHQAFRAAVTAMAISALIEVGGDSPEVQQSLDRAEAWLMDNLPQVRRANGDAIYNVWTHSYGISGLVHMLERHANDPDRSEKIKQLIQDQIGMLQRYECVDGGWAYYDFRARDAVAGR